MAVFRCYVHLYYVRRLKLPHGTTGDASFFDVSRVHPRNNLILRDGTFRKVDWIYYNPVRRIVEAVFVPGIFSALHPRLRNNWARGVEFRYYKTKRTLPPVTAVAADTSFNAVSRVHPSRNFLLRQRKTEQRYYQIKRTLPPSVVTVVSFVAVSKVHPSRNLRLRNETFRAPSLAVYQPKRVIYPSLFVAGILILVSKVHPSKNRRLRDETFRPPYLHYYQPDHVGAFNLDVVATGLTEVLFKGMWRGMFRSMR